MQFTGNAVPPGIPIAHTPDRPPRVWAAAPNHHHHAQNQSMQQPYIERQDVQIDSSLEENDLIGLDLSSAQIRSLPLGLLNYTDFLTELRLNGNLLTSLPPQVGDLRSLVVLDLSDNHLTFLPAELGKLTNLVELLLYNNKLSTLPPEMGYLYQLESLGLEGNPWDEPIVGVLMTQGPMAIVPFLRDNLLGIARPPLSNNFVVIEPPPERIWQVLDNSPPTPGKSTLAHNLLTYPLFRQLYHSDLQHIG
jgi:CCR4-NOT transcription complex subunit 6